MRSVLIVLLCALFLGIQCAVIMKVSDAGNIVRRLKRAVVIAPAPRPPTVVVAPPRPPTVVVVPPRKPTVVVVPPRPG
ncbi:hypothetical protein RB195_005308 [Necator americanus]|uniref:Uncharacterized protein n=2 Tax=Necator americanus TaxID=51031 RepID=A0ABR1BM74_NECAM|nr:hypothetical protein NECAME_10122 [Necator americanus]ETN78822.1 hypothetical protein NECAME_10122 [Necator americanus]